MKKSKPQVSQSRRMFLKDAGRAGAIGIGAAAAVGAPGVAIAETTAAEDQKPAEGYRLTQHILDYYKSAAS